jgi:hypothetical protein
MRGARKSECRPAVVWAVSPHAKEHEMRAPARATTAVPRRLFEGRDEPPAEPVWQESEPRALVALDDLASTLEVALARVNELREWQRTAPAAA